MPQTMYTKDEIDQMLAAQYQSTRTELDDATRALQSQIDALKPPPPAPAGKIIGVGGISAFKGMKISGLRTYNGFTGSRGFNPASILVTMQNDQIAGRRSYLSIDSGTKKGNADPLNQDWPTTLDLTKQPADMFIPSVKIVQQDKGLLIIHHEPENDPGLAANFKTWFGLVADYYRKQVPGIQIGLCLMEWTGRLGIQNFGPWTPDPSKFDVFCSDNYALKSTDTADLIFKQSLLYARQLKKPLLITETGITSTLDQVPYLKSLDAFVQANDDVQGFLYWNQGSFVLNPNGLAFFGSLVSGGKYLQSTNPV